jgi:hypothetical protein
MTIIRDNAKVIIYHDTEACKHYKYNLLKKEIFDKYRHFSYRTLRVHTNILIKKDLSPDVFLKNLEKTNKNFINKHNLNCDFNVLELF